jgi:hypothetical protein
MANPLMGFGVQQQRVQQQLRAGLQAGMALAAAANDISQFADNVRSAGNLFYGTPKASDTSAAFTPQSTGNGVSGVSSSYNVSPVPFPGFAGTPAERKRSSSGNSPGGKRLRLTLPVRKRVPYGRFTQLNDKDRKRYYNRKNA